MQGSTNAAAVVPAGACVPITYQHHHFDKHAVELLLLFGCLILGIKHKSGCAKVAGKGEEILKQSKINPFFCLIKLIYLAPFISSAFLQLPVLQLRKEEAAIYRDSDVRCVGHEDKGHFPPLTLCFCDPGNNLDLLFPVTVGLEPVFSPFCSGPPFRASLGSSKTSNSRQTVTVSEIIQKHKKIDKKYV